MAKPNTTPAQAQTPTPAPATPATPAKPAKAKKPKKAIRVPAPQILQDAVAKAAAEAPGKPSPAIWIRDLVARTLGVTIPPTATRTRTVYASKDEKKAAQKARRKSRADLVKNLLAQYEAQQAAAAQAAPTPPAA